MFAGINMFWARLRLILNDNKTLWRICFSPALRENVNKLWNGFSILIGCLDRTIIWLSLLIGLFRRARIHFSPPKSPFKPAKCATMPDKVIVIHIEVAFSALMTSSILMLHFLRQSYISYFDARCIFYLNDTFYLDVAFSTFITFST